MKGPDCYYDKRNNQWSFLTPASVYDKWNLFVVICDRYSIPVHQVMVATVKLLK